MHRAFQAGVAVLKIATIRDPLFFYQKIPAGILFSQWAMLLYRFGHHLYPAPCKY
jgi:hypothetical protein